MRDLATITRETRRILSSAFGNVTIAKESKIHARLFMKVEFSEVEIIEVGIHNVVVNMNHETWLMPMRDVENVFLTIGKGSTLFVNLETGLWEDAETGKLPWEVNQ